MKIIICISAMIFFFVVFGVYQIKSLTQDARLRVAELKRNIQDTHESIDILEAEWKYLNDLGRLQLLADKYYDVLRLAPIRPTQMLRLDNAIDEDHEIEEQIIQLDIMNKGYFASSLFTSVVSDNNLLIESNNDKPLIYNRSLSANYEQSY